MCTTNYNNNSSTNHDHYFSKSDNHDNRSATDNDHNYTINNYYCSNWCNGRFLWESHKRSGTSGGEFYKPQHG